MVKVKLLTLGVIMSVILVVVTVLVVGGSVFIVKDVEDLDKVWHDYAEGAFQKGILLQEMDAAMGYGGMIHHFKNYVLRRTPERYKKAKVAMRSYQETAAKFWEKKLNPRESAAIKVISETVDAYAVNLEKVSDLVAQGKSTNEIDGVVKIDDGPALEGLAVLRAEFIKSRDLQTAKMDSGTNTIIGLATNNALATGIILIGMVVFLIWFTHFRLLRPLKQMVECMKDLASGNNQVEIHAAGRGDEIGDMADAVEVFKANASSLISITDTIIQASREVANASKEISAGSLDLSQRTEQQAANIEETSASMTQLATTVVQNSENADNANHRSVTARDVANRGREVVNSAVQAMSEIEVSSKKISDIIGVIDEIAFQTNLLALNAAVEAARAGDAGKGFAVVATEVGKLARRSADAAKDIKDLIASSDGHVINGVKLVGETGSALAQIVDSVKDVAELMSEIAVASKEQANSIQEMNEAIAQMDDMTQQNSALVEESAAATRALEEQAIFLNQSVISLDRTDRDMGERDLRQHRAAQRPARRQEAAGPRGGGGKRGDNEKFSFNDDDWQEF
jgi:methyl-accepting chemotaxis protein